MILPSSLTKIYIIFTLILYIIFSFELSLVSKLYKFNAYSMLWLWLQITLNSCPIKQLDSFWWSVVGLPCLFTGAALAYRLAIDYSTGNLFYTAVVPTEYQSYIGVVHRSTSLHKTLIYNLNSPKDITLYISKG